MKARNWTQLKKSMTTEQLNRFCKKLAEQYANSESYFAMDYFCKLHNITTSCYYKVKEYAVTQNLVDDDIVNKMMRKSAGNRDMHAKDAGVATVAKFARMSEERKKNKIIQTAIEFADNPDISKKDLAVMRGITVKEYDMMLVAAIEENLVNDLVVSAMEDRSIKNAASTNVERTVEFFDGLKKKRAAFIKGITLQ